MNSKVCRLCLTNKPNMKAHIMAEGLMKLIHGQQKYDGNFIMVGDNLKSPKRRPTGSYDRNILCDTCDNKLGVLDKVAIDFCKRTDLKPHSSGVAFILSNVDQEKLKLFAMSYIWRASITSLDEFKTVSLGKVHEDRIAEMLRKNDCGSDDDYSVIVARFSLPSDKKIWGKHVLNPTNNRLDGVNIVDAYLPNLYKLIIKVDKRPFEKGLKEFVLGKNDDVLIMNLGDYSQTQEFNIFYRGVMKDYKKRGRNERG